MIVVLITWRDASTLRSQHFGPFEVRPDGSHLDYAARFVRMWAKKNGQPTEVLMATVESTEETMSGEFDGDDY